MRFDVMRLLRQRPDAQPVDRLDYLARGMVAVLLIAAVVWAAMNGG